MICRASISSYNSVDRTQELSLTDCRHVASGQTTDVTLVGEVGEGQSFRYSWAPEPAL